MERKPSPMPRPGIVSNLCAMAGLIEHCRTGLLVEPGNPKELAAKVTKFLASPPEREADMRHAACAEYEAKYTTDRNYQLLVEIYRKAIERAKPKR